MITTLTHQTYEWVTHNVSQLSFRLCFSITVIQLDHYINFKKTKTLAYTSYQSVYLSSIEIYQSYGMYRKCCIQ